jgi:signal peptide peptidase SppA
MSALCGFSSYSGIAKSFTSALNDASVRGILLKINSPGGSTHGLFELCNTLSTSKRQKPLYAVAKHLAASAAYAIASCCDKIFVSITGAVGSIGVFSLHCDQSGADKIAGLKYEYVKYGAKKTEGNEHAALSSSARSDLQAEINRQGDMFVNLVAKNRKESFGKIKDTEAGIYNGITAVPLLADAVGTFEDALAEMSRKPLDNGATIPLRRAAATSDAVSAEEVTMPPTVETPATPTSTPAPVAVLPVAAPVAAPVATPPAPLAASQKACSACHGTGMVDDKTCETCGGTGKVPMTDGDGDNDSKKSQATLLSQSTDGITVLINGTTHFISTAAPASTAAPLPISTTAVQPKETPMPPDQTIIPAAAAPNPAATGASPAILSRTEIDDIGELCAIAGQENLFLGFVQSNTPVADVRKKLRDSRAEALASGVDPKFGVPAVTGADPLLTFNQAVTLAASQNPNMKRSDVIMQVMRQNRGLYMQYEDSRDVALSSPGAKRKYLSELGPRLAAIGLCGHRA